MKGWKGRGTDCLKPVKGWKGEECSKPANGREECEVGGGILGCRVRINMASRREGWYFTGVSAIWLHVGSCLVCQKSSCSPVLQRERETANNNRTTKTYVWPLSYPISGSTTDPPRRYLDWYLLQTMQL
jgi:hypothetical protein